MKSSNIQHNGSGEAHIFISKGGQQTRLERKIQKEKYIST